VKGSRIRKPVPPPVEEIFLEKLRGVLTKVQPGAVNQFSGVSGRKFFSIFKLSRDYMYRGAIIIIIIIILISRWRRSASDVCLFKGYTEGNIVIADAVR